jgi:hypothetical protein
VVVRQAGLRYVPVRKGFFGGSDKASDVDWSRAKTELHPGRRTMVESLRTSECSTVA